ncbi:MULTISPECIES: phosphodiesterase [Mycobacterium]|uniref:3',5'-cyclic adenosine monophosphate phosphodiesterase CpdA n=1 Tax=Mycobacterium kiyosense TaxID=2871094 RepID=A0A9P3Q4Y5_9MYCO|nr:MULTISPECIES: phosphodiesterase [Mycobacterium]BDB45117.1 3',5'-cyclic adenosine monophosphate phosphodiesterase CpdA [Mycobacterium kiyosense]BDE16594.1 3',5'-cyclic adenosine monophosphate phosphodiesterase CpdA [Mycobacterium sp. 20KCMC460]GLB84736.1 3',5'-cyclic adenosine monophosphate phosphodiesterase CpdA [Mycobacterium kiyosense]GLB89865.1 3',5'-cyclic adenosine monophosphate phosphodiesterase CpdA [Mycobacterium kiyosense]GLB95835.1 3',5'-cyclic adenosine monophosphate phosphodiest
MHRLRAAEHPRPDYVLLHISDTHLAGGDGPLYGDVDADGRLAELLDQLDRSGLRPDAIVCTGDLADKGEPAAYRKLRDLVEPFATELGAELVWVMGNHDDRAELRRQLLDEAPSLAPLDAVRMIDGLRIVTLDTSVPGHHYGELRPAQLDWLADELASPAPDGTILALHHPPIPSVLDMAVTVELRDQASLGRVLKGTDVRAILAGHLHYSTNATFVGIPVSVASATCYTQDLTVCAGGTRGRDAAQACNLVHVYPDTVVHSVVPLGGGKTVGTFVSPGQAQRNLAEAGIFIEPSRRDSLFRHPQLALTSTQDAVD